MIIPPYMESIVLANASGRVVDEVMVSLQENAEAMPGPLLSRSLGNWSLSMNGKDLRPDGELTFDIIDEMMKSGIVVFSVLMKLSQIMTVFRSWRGWKIVSPDTELAEIATANLRYVLPQMMIDGGYRSLIDGSAFMELRWWNRNKYQLGLSNSRAAARLWTVAKRPHLVDPRTISHIRRKGPAFEYNGFIQRHNLKPGQDIIIERDNSLVLPYNEQFRNLWGKSFLQPIYPYWFWFEVVLRSTVRYIERMGIPTVLAEAPMMDTLPDPNSPGGTIKALNYMANVAASLAYSNYAAIPSDYDMQSNTRKYNLQYLTADDRTSALVGVLQELSQLILRSALSADRALTQSSGGVGSYNIGELHAAATSLHNQMILTNWMYYLNLYFLPWFSVYNRGVDGPPIWIEVQALDPEYRKLLQQLLGAMGNSTAGQEAQWMIDTRTLFELSNVPVLSEEEVKARREEARRRAVDQGAQQQKLNGNDEEEKEPDDDKTVAELAYLGLAKTLEDGGTLPISISEQHLHDLLKLRGNRPKFRERDHPRDRRGRFRGKGGGGGAASAPKKPEDRGDPPEMIPLKRVAKSNSPKEGRSISTGRIGFGALGGIAAGQIASLLMNSQTPASLEKQEQTLDRIKDMDEEQKDRIRRALANRPTYNSMDEAMSATIDQLESMGLDIPDDIKLDIVNGDPVKDGWAGYYDPDTNTFKIMDDFASRILDGDIQAVQILVHEVAHSSQETGLENDLVVPADAGLSSQTAFIDHLEGLNDVVTSMALSEMYGDVPIENNIIGRAHEVLYGKNPRERPVKYGYTDAATAIAAVALSQPNPIEYIKQSHQVAMDYNQLVEFLPPEVISRERSGPDDVSYPNIPNRLNPIDPTRETPSGELERWLRERYPGDSLQQAYVKYIEYYLENKDR